MGDSCGRRHEPIARIISLGCACVVFLVFVLIVTNRGAQARAADVETLEESGVGGDETESTPFSRALIQRVTARFTGDLPEMQKRRLIRVLVEHNRTSFFVAAGRPRGFECEMLEQYEKFLNRNVKRRKDWTTIVFLPAPHERLIPLLKEGKGDIAAGGLTITKEQEDLVAFTDPYLTGVNEIVVTSKSAPALKSLDDLAGRKIYVIRGSSYARHLVELNETLKKKGLPALKIVYPEQHLDTEDLLELVNAGVLDITVCDDHIARLWSSIFTNIVLHPDLVVHANARIAWAVRKNNPVLRASLNAFVKRVKKGTLLGNLFLKRYYKSTQWIKNPLTKKEIKKLQQYVQLFQKYAKMYRLDWRALAAQAYQESRLNQNLKSETGAIGIMQVMPETARQLGISNVKDVENNIHAAAKYMRYLMDTLADDPGVGEAAKWDLALAAYNAGPNRLKRWRKKAQALGLDPNKWFDNVEQIAWSDAGRETVEYVRNVNKYYVAYALAGAIGQGKEQANQ